MLSLRRAATFKSLSKNTFLRCLGSGMPANEPCLDFGPGSSHRAKLEEALERVNSQTLEIPTVVGGKDHFTGDTKFQLAPHDHKKKVARYHLADEALIQQAIDSAMAARPNWEAMSFEHRGAIFKKVADLISTRYRYDMLAATMIGQSKTVFQAEIDCIAELVDFYRFGVHYAQQVYKSPELIQPANVINSYRYRGLEGFVAAVTPFNFTAIGGNLSGTPVLMGNVMLWKPSSTAILSNYLVFKIFQEAGIPDGVVNFVPSKGMVFGSTITASPHLAAVTFTGSTGTFNFLWKAVAQNIDKYKDFPRVLGECGGKNYHFVHETADVPTVVNCTIRAAFEYGGQKCSACSRLYVPDNLWPEIKEQLTEECKKIKTGPPEDYESFTCAVIDEASFDNIQGYINYASELPTTTIVHGGKCDKSVGYYVEPTIIETQNPKDKLMQEEIFGPIITVYVYKAGEYKETLNLINETSPFGLTGAIFAKDREVIVNAMSTLKYSCGNMYLNDKSTGSVVGQQPFGGARLSGTNDKAGGASFLSRFVSPQSIKETLVPVGDWKYPYMKN